MEKTQDVKLDFSVLDKEELALLKSQTGIENMEELREHVESVVGKAHNVFRYECLTRLVFLKSKYPRLPAYKHVLELGKSREDTLFLDIGCCFGHDTRKAVWDGYPIQNIIASDLYPEFWDLGHELFKSTPETFPVPFIPGDIFDDHFIPDRMPVMKTSTTERPSLQSLASSKSLAPLQGHISAIHASALFHLFREEPQRRIAKKLASLLSPVPGSVIFGLHRGLPEAREIQNVGKAKDTIFGHSPASWKKLWAGGETEEGVFPPHTVEVDASITQIPGTDVHMLAWSVTRI
ncbi:hypothetical protein K435DRAFT_852453 [Dendrothele bispora CBS 962.96]|uniref:Methyltransferase domain-containing protein n=1 Tax=Dendrothele bispora (strain CBS 962.96) TaxID=1314807 RepID=A0A4S8MK24_DENBC|nr:hypothetical protein K435DRAFT_852453 [Dendrothele bispora CBS 962.96]